MLVISQSKLVESGVGMEIYVHQQGKIHRKIPGKTTILIPPIFNPNGEEFHHEFSIRGIELLQRRETGRIPCNKSIDNMSHVSKTGDILLPVEMIRIIPQARRFD